MDQIREISVDDVRQLVAPDYMARGVEVFDANLVSATSRYANKLFANVAGSGANPYRVSVIFEAQVKAKCTCPAARRVPFCKHAAAVLIAWSRAPRGFVESDTEIEVVERRAKKASVKKSRTSSADLIDRGLSDLKRLLTELGASGLSTMTAERCGQVRELGDNLRTLQLRRLSAAVIRLSELLAASLSSKQELSFDEYNSTLVEIALTERAVRQTQQGKLTDPKYQEELVGKTWSKTSLTRLGPKRLSQISFRKEPTADGYLIHERHLIDVDSGELYSEKSIAPAFIAKRQTVPFGKNFKRISCDDLLVYPGFSPNRVRLEGAVETAMENAAVEKVLDFAVAGFESAVAQHMEFRKDIFAPRESVAFVKSDGLYYDMRTLNITDAGGRCLEVKHTNISELMLRLEAKGVLGVFGHVSTKDGIYLLEPLTVFCRSGADFITISC